MDKARSKRVYAGMLNHLREKILDGTFKPNECVDTEFELAEKFSISRSSVRAGLKELIEEGILTAVQGRGNVVVPPAGRMDFHRNKTMNILFSIPFPLGMEGQELFNAQVIEGAGDYCNAAGHGLVYDVFTDFRDERGFFNNLERNNCSGIIWMYPNESFQPLMGKVAELGLPQVALDREVEGLSSVCADSESAFRDILDFLVGIGHREIAFLNVDWEGEVYQTRRRVFFEGVERLGIPEAKGFYRSGPSAAMPEVLDSLFAGGGRPTALVVGGFVLLRENLAWFRKRDIPGDLSVICVNDSLWARIHNPPMSVYAEPRYEMGRKAVTLLEQLAFKRLEPTRLRLKGELVVRKTCAAPHGGKRS